VPLGVEARGAVELPLGALEPPRRLSLRVVAYPLLFDQGDGRCGRADLRPKIKAQRRLWRAVRMGSGRRRDGPVFCPDRHRRGTSLKLGGAKLVSPDSNFSDVP
jgi:hypothetical protein